MGMNRREFLQLLAAASVAGFHLNPRLSFAANQPANPYELPVFGNVSLLHYTDCHAQLLPIYYREPSVNLGIAGMLGKPPHLVGEHFLKHYKIEPKSLDAHAFTYLDFAEAAKQYGKVGGFAHLKTLVDQIRAQRKGALLLDGGDTWQGSWTALKTKAQDMVDAQLALGVNVMTAHWEMTYGADRVKEIIEKDFAGKIDFVAQNVMSTDFEEPVFAPYVIKEVNGVPVAIIGQAFPYTPVANPKHLIPEWSFGIRDDRMQAMVNEARGKGAKVVVVLSHNGMDVDLKMASKVTGIDAIMGGHTHDGPLPRHRPRDQTHGDTYRHDRRCPKRSRSASHRTCAGRDPCRHQNPSYGTTGIRPFQRKGQPSSSAQRFLQPSCHQPPRGGCSYFSGRQPSEISPCF